MRLAMVGLGRMGANMVRRLMKGDPGRDRGGGPDRCALGGTLRAVPLPTGHTFGEKLPSAMRHELGGYVERPTGG